MNKFSRWISKMVTAHFWAIIIFLTLYTVLAFSSHFTQARGETAVCAEKSADVLRICPSLKVDSEIASGNEAAVLARKALYALRNGEDPEVFVPLLAGWLRDADLTLAEFGVAHQGLMDVVNRYYMAEKRRLNIYAMAKRGEGEKAFREIRLIHKKEDEVLVIVKTDFAPYPVRLIDSIPRY